MSNSNLITYSKISPNKNSPRNHAIDTLTIHCAAMDVNALTLATLFLDPKRGASANYVIGKNGGIILCVDEGDRSWCSSNPENDHRAITIEVASDSVEPYGVSCLAWESLIDLAFDVCQRNSITKLVWLGDDPENVNYERKPGEALMTLHKWFSKKACPGPFLISRMPEIARLVNERLSKDKITTYQKAVDILLDAQKQVVEMLSTQK